LEKQSDGVCVLYLKSGENRFNPNFVEEINKALDEVEKDKASRILITIGEGKFFSNGLDLSWIREKVDQGERFLDQFHKFLARMLVFPLLTIAAINGHAFGAGMMFALSHDFRIMRNERGYLCIPAIELQISLSLGMLSLIGTKITNSLILRDSILLGKRFDSKEALTLKLVDQICDENSLLSTSLELSKGLVVKGHRETMEALKVGMYQQCYQCLMKGSHGFKSKL